MPSPGIIKRCHIPGGPGIRVDTHLFSGYEVPRYYDSLMAKVIARGKDREEAIQRLSGALDEFITEGVENTARLCARIIRGDRFRVAIWGPTCWRNTSRRTTSPPERARLIPPRPSRRPAPRCFVGPVHRAALC